MICHLGLCLAEKTCLYWKFKAVYYSRDSDAHISREWTLFAVNVNVKAVFSTNRNSNLVNEGKHVFAFTPCGIFTSILPKRNGNLKSNFS